jgi:hypothetical protein
MRARPAFGTIRRWPRILCLPVGSAVVIYLTLTKKWARLGASSLGQQGLARDILPAKRRPP